MRIDFLLRKGQARCFLEVKNSVVVEQGVARFPDSITPRGLKHLEGLTRKAKEGHRAVLLFVVQRGDVKSFAITSLHHPAYARAVQKALRAGVELLAISFEVSPKGFSLPRLLAVS